MALFNQGKYVYFLNCLLFYLITDKKISEVHCVFPANYSTVYFHGSKLPLNY